MVFLNLTWSFFYHRFVICFQKMHSGIVSLLFFVRTVVFHGGIVASPSCTFSAIDSIANVSSVIDSMYFVSFNIPFYRAFLLVGLFAISFYKGIIFAWLLRPFRALLLLYRFIHRALPYAMLLRPFRTLLIYKSFQLALPYAWL